MTIKESKFIINNKLKMYRNSQIGEVAIGLTSCSAAVVNTSLISIKYINGIENIALRLGTFFGVALVNTTVFSLISFKFMNLDEKRKLEITKLKEIKKGLKKGINPFEDISEKEFEELYVKYELKNKTK